MGDAELTRVLSDSLESKNEESRRRERHMMFVLYAATWMIGLVLMGLYVFFFDTPSWLLFAAMGAAPVAVLVAHPLRDPKHSRLWYLPGIWAVTGMTFYAAVYYEHLDLAMYMLLPGIFMAIFFWRSRPLTALHMFGLCALFFVCPFMIGVDEPWRAAVITTPEFMTVLLLLGYLGAHANRLLIERSRFESTISSLLVALQERDGQTADTARHVVELATRVGRRFSLGDEQMQLIQDAARLHDVGKIGIPNELLNKPAVLSADEWLVMRTHPEIGERIVSTVPGFDDVALVIRHTHERWDGHGYPDRLAAHEIPLASRIIFACDAYEAMVSQRPFRGAMSHEEACAELKRGAGDQFDTRVIDELIDVLDGIQQAQMLTVVHVRPRVAVA